MSDYLLAMLQVDPAANIKVQPFNSETKLGVSDNRYQLFASLAKKKDEPDQVHVYHCIPHRYRRPVGAKKCFGFCVFETMNPPADWIRMMNEMDAVITASVFNERIFRTHGVTVPIHVIPHCFDAKLFNKEVQPTGRYNMKTFLAMGTWKMRKNWETLIKAFYDAFDKKDNVCLLIKTDKPKDLEMMVQRVKRSSEWRTKDTAPIFAEQRTHCNFEEIPQFMKKGDFYISCSIGEGFGISGAHAMALNIPVITTKFGGCTEYAKQDNCTFIEPKHYKTYPVMDGIPQFANCIWPVINTIDVKEKMIEVLKNSPTEKTQKAYEFAHDNLSYDVIGKKYLEVLSA